MWVDPSCPEYLEAGFSRVRTASIVFDLGLMQGIEILLGAPDWGTGHPIN